MDCSELYVLKPNVYLTTTKLFIKPGFVPFRPFYVCCYKVLRNHTKWMQVWEWTEAWAHVLVKLLLSGNGWIQTLEHVTFLQLHPKLYKANSAWITNGWYFRVFLFWFSFILHSWSWKEVSQTQLHVWSELWSHWDVSRGCMLFGFLMQSISPQTGMCAHSVCSRMQVRNFGLLLLFSGWKDMRQTWSLYNVKVQYVIFF